MANRNRYVISTQSASCFLTTNGGYTFDIKYAIKFKTKQEALAAAPSYLKVKALW